MAKHLKRNKTEEDTNFVLSNMTEGVLVVDNQKNILMINKSGLTYLNIITKNPIGLKIDKAIKDENFQSYINELIESNTAQKREIRIKKNMDRFFLVNGTILQGPQSGYLVVLSDITKLKQLEKIRQDFVANVSHELKTPITKSLQRKGRLTMYPTMYLSKKSYIRLLIDLGQTTERPPSNLIYCNSMHYSISFKRSSLM